jgi:hypothetical protein
MRGGSRCVVVVLVLDGVAFALEQGDRGGDGEQDHR